MDIIVENTNVLPDLFRTGLIRHCLKMDLSFHTSRQVYREMADTAHKAFYRSLVANGLLVIDPFDGDDFILLAKIFEELSSTSGLTEADCSVILLAERYECQLLTTDQKLARVARERGIQVNDFLWIADTMVEQGIVGRLSMAEYLETYLIVKKSVPREMAQERINKYKGKILWAEPGG